MCADEVHLVGRQVVLFRCIMGQSLVAKLYWEYYLYIYLQALMTLEPMITCDAAQHPFHFVSLQLSSVGQVKSKSVNLTFSCAHETYISCGIYFRSCHQEILFTCICSSGNHWKCLIFSGRYQITASVRSHLFAVGEEKDDHRMQKKFCCFFSHPISIS